MELTQDKKDLISKIIKNDRKFSENEDLYDDFFRETCKRSFSIIQALDNDPALEAYLRRIVSTSIINVLKDFGRLRRTPSTYVTNKKAAVEAITPKIPSKEIKDYNKISVDYSNIRIPKTPENVAIQQEMLEYVGRSVKMIDNDNPDKQYLKIYIMRYDQGLTQKEISQELNISQSEVSKRLFKLMREVKSIVE